MTSHQDQERVRKDTASPSLHQCLTLHASDAAGVCGLPLSDWPCSVGQDKALRSAFDELDRIADKLRFQPECPVRRIACELYKIAVDTGTLKGRSRLVRAARRPPLPTHPPPPPAHPSLSPHAPTPPHTHIHTRTHNVQAHPRVPALPHKYLSCCTVCDAELSDSHELATLDASHGKNCHRSISTAPSCTLYLCPRL